MNNYTSCVVIFRIIRAPFSKLLTAGPDCQNQAGRKCAFNCRLNQVCRVHSEWIPRDACNCIQSQCKKSIVYNQKSFLCSQKTVYWNFDNRKVKSPIVYKNGWLLAGGLYQCRRKFFRRMSINMQRIHVLASTSVIRKTVEPAIRNAYYPNLSICGMIEPIKIYSY